MFVAPRPENTSRQNSSQDKSELHWNGGSTNVRILPVHPEFKGQNSLSSANGNGISVLRTYFPTLCFSVKFFYDNYYLFPEG